MSSEPPRDGLPVDSGPAGDATPGDGPNPAPMQRLHWSSVFFETISHGRQILVPAAIGFLGAANGNWYWTLLALIGFAFALVTTLFKYFTLRFGIRNRELVVSHGLLFRQVRTVPTRLIQNMDLVQNLLHRPFGVAEVRIETASGAEAEAVLRVLTLKQVDVLRAEIFSSGTKAALAGPLALTEASGISEPGPSGAVLPVAAAPPVELVRIPWRWLLVVGLASNRGWLLVGVAIGAFFNFVQFDSMDGKAWRKWIPWISSHLPGWWTTALLIAAGLVLLKLLGMAWFILRFHGYRLVRAGDDLRVTCGLLTSYSATVPRQRIQFLSLQSSPLLRLCGLQTIRIETAGSSASSGEDAQSSMTRSWFIPVVPRDQTRDLLRELRPGLDWDEAAVAWQPPSPLTWRRLARMVVLLPVLASVAGGIWLPPWGWLAGVALAGPLLYSAWRQSRGQRYARTGFGVAFRSGLVNRKLSLTFFERLQVLRLEQSPFDRRWKMARLKLDTASAGPAEHLIHAGFLDESFAREEFKALETLAARHQPVWK